MSTPYVGEIRMFGGNFAPVGWAFCDGALLPISENEVLFQLIGTTYGGDGQNTFALPDLRGRVPVHQGSGPGLSNRIIIDQHFRQRDRLGLVTGGEPDPYPTKGEFVFKVYDPDFFIAFDYPKDDPVTVIGQVPPGCQLVVKPVPTDAELEQTRAMLATKGTDWKPAEDEEFGSLFAQPVTIQCKA